MVLLFCHQPMHRLMGICVLTGSLPIYPVRTPAVDTLLTGGSYRRQHYLINVLMAIPMHQCMAVWPAPLVAAAFGGICRWHIPWGGASCLISASSRAGLIANYANAKFGEQGQCEVQQGCRMLQALLDALVMNVPLPMTAPETSRLMAEWMKHEFLHIFTVKAGKIAAYVIKGPRLHGLHSHVWVDLVADKLTACPWVPLNDEHISASLIAPRKALLTSLQAGPNRRLQMEG